ncbi:carbamoyltransferase HypF [Streptomyces sp. NPDC127098]|uniref:carbamoyltransferase HypF n=1 Tax=Streptomyces sp. NPDC127098 TaxID=3347137 RepID=UPI003657F48A
MASRREAWRIEVSGTVQGVGFRPFVHRTATSLGIEGWVRNVDGLVVAAVTGCPERLAELAARCRDAAPALAKVGRVTVGGLVPGEPPPGPGFTVLASVGRTDGGAVRELPVDAAPCRDCLRELSDPADRRHRYPFVNCTACGPRATVITDLPYDRERTTMRAFPLCGECAAEYADPADRRFHAEPLACPRCGPRLSWRSGGVTAMGEAALAAAVAAVAAGALVAVKGVGGYQLVCDATRPEAVAALRRHKRRPDKPFAVLVRDLATAARLAVVGPAEAAVLASPASPVVLLPARPAAGLAPEVHPGTTRIGLMLPASPLHQLLAGDADRPLVCTSGNAAGAPMAVDDAEAAAGLDGVADGFLGHDRPIHARSDDSVVTLVRGRTLTVRRARGHAPAPARLPVAAPRPLVAAGAQLKHTFTLASGELAVVAPHTGDLGDVRTMDAFETAFARLSHLTGITPELVAHDLHPGYASTAWAARWPAERRVAVQHHHAHVAACAAEHGLVGPFTGVALDGLGFGADGTLWGGEVLVADLREFRRVGRFGTAPLPGGEAAVRVPFRMALGYLLGGERLGGPRPDPALVAAFAGRRSPRESGAVRAMVERGVNCPRASSAGRLFDAAASVLGLCDTVSYEGQAALALEAAAGDLSGEPLPWRIARAADGLPVYDPAATLGALLEGLAAGVPVPRLAAGFHTAVARATAGLVELAVADGAPRMVCLGGGCFQNARLLTEVSDRLGAAGLRVLVGSAVPVNDGGISFGQAAVAAARSATAEKEGSTCASASRVA